MNNKRTSLLQRFVAAPYTVWSVLFIVIPLVMVVYYTFTDSNGVFTTVNVAKLVEKEYLSIFARSVAYAFIATVVCLVIAFPLAYFISQTKPRTQKLAIMLTMLPMWTNLVIRTYSLGNLIEDTGVINTALGLLDNPIHMINTPFAVILGMVYNYLPFMVLPIHTVISKLDKNVIEASQDLGCNKFKVITKVILPLSKSGIVSGITMVFVPAISTFYISKKLGGTDNRLIGEVIEDSFLYSENWNFGSAISFVLMIIIMLSIAIVNKFSDDEEGGGMLL
ncbi:MAG: ABC transporter permease [Clostridia bacterium]|nr:ABC transporter permease [Clostridia bacterium]